MDYQKLIEHLKHMQIDIKDAPALTEAIYIISDYEKATAQTSEMIERYEKAEMAVRRQAGLYTCPMCGKRAIPGHTHCHWCGKKMMWDRDAYADRGYPHLKDKGGTRRNGKGKR